MELNDIIIGINNFEIDKKVIDLLDVVEKVIDNESDYIRGSMIGFIDEMDKYYGAETMETLCKCIALTSNKLAEVITKNMVIDENNNELDRWWEYYITMFILMLIYNRRNNFNIPENYIFERIQYLIGGIESGFLS